MKLCRDCKHHEFWEDERWSTQQHQCGARADQAKIDVVTGKPINPHDNCYASRRDDTMCGPDGNWWQSSSE